MAQVYQDQGKLAEALSELKSALNIDPTRWRTHQALGRVYLQQKEYSAAVEAFRTAQKYNPDMPPFAQLALVEALIEVKQIEEAAEILRKMLPFKAIEPRKHELWGDIYQRQGLLKEAIEEYGAALITLEAEDTLNGLVDIDTLSGQDEGKWQEVLAGYKAAAHQRVSEAQTLARANFQKSLFGL
jgi:tetratricopeptide (TPR) repeat protein